MNHPTGQAYPVGRPASSGPVSPDPTHFKGPDSLEALEAFAARFTGRLFGQLCWSASRDFRAPLAHWYGENGLQGVSFDLLICNRWGVSPGAGSSQSSKAEPSITGDVQATGNGIGERSG